MAKSKSPEPETLHTCPDCGQENFTAKGLAAHQGKKACIARQKEKSAALVKAHPEVAACVARFNVWHEFAKQGAMALKLAKYFAGLEVNTLYELHRSIHGETRGGGEACELPLEAFIEQQLAVTMRSARRYRDWFLDVATPEENAPMVKRLNAWWASHKPKLLDTAKEANAGNLSLHSLCTLTADDFKKILEHPDDWGLHELFEAPLRDVTPEDDDPPDPPKKIDPVVFFWHKTVLGRFGRKDYLRLPKPIRESLATKMEEAIAEIKQTLKPAKKKAAKKKAAKP